MRVTHSIPDGVAVAVDTAYGMIVHTGDFKMDPDAVDGFATDLPPSLARRRGGVHVLMSDSTNAEDPGRAPVEKTVGPILRDIVSNAPGIVVVACFSSQIHRTQQVIDAAVDDDVGGLDFHGCRASNGDPGIGQFDHVSKESLIVIAASSLLSLKMTT